MIQEEIARLTGKLVFQVDNRPLMAFEKRLGSVMGQLRELGVLANKRFNIKVQLDARTLREQLARAAAAKVVIKDFNISNEALAVAAKRISDRLDNTPITLNKVRVDIKSLVDTKKVIRTLIGQIGIDLPVKFQLSAANAVLRAWKAEVESKFKLRINADISEANFLRNVRASLARASSKIGAVHIETPPIKLNIDRAHLKQEIRDVLAQIRRETSIRVDLTGHSSRAPRSSGGGRAEAGGISGGRLASASMGFARGAIPGLGAAFAVGAVNRINQELTASSTALEAVSGNSEEFASNMDFLQKLTEEQGRNMRDVAPQFTSVLASAKESIGSQGTQDLFRGLMKYGTVMGLDGEAMKGSMRAISQMFSKDKIQAEEAQGQLAERLPAAMQLLAKANGTDVPGLREAMQKGALDPKKVLPEMARIMEDLAEANGAYAKALASTRVQQGRMNRQFEKSVSIMSEAGFDEGMSDFFGTMATSMQKAEPLIKAMGVAFNMLMRPINALVSILGTLGEHWDSIASSMGLTGGQLSAIATVAGIAVLPFGSLAIAIGAAALAIQDLIIFSEGGESVFGNFLKSSPEALAAFQAMTTEAKQYAKNLSDAVNWMFQLVGGMEGLSFPTMFTTTMRELAMLLKVINDTFDRFKMAGAYSEMMGGGVIAQNKNNMEAMIKGPDWARMQMQQAILERMNTSVDTVGDVPTGAPGPSVQAIVDAVDRLAAIRDEREVAGPAQIGDMTIKVDFSGAMMPEAIAEQMKAPFEKIANQVFGNAILEARSQTKEVRR